MTAYARPKLKSPSSSKLSTHQKVKTPNQPGKSIKNLLVRTSEMLTFARYKPGKRQAIIPQAANHSNTEPLTSKKRTSQWGTADGRTLEIWQMETDHLINCIRHIERRNETAYLSTVFRLYKVVQEGERNFYSYSVSTRLELLLSEGPQISDFGEEVFMYKEMRAEVFERTGKIYGYYLLDSNEQTV